MKSTSTPYRKTGRLIVKNLIVMLVLIVVSILSIWSWFTKDTKAWTDNLGVSCESPDGIEIAIVAHGASAPKSSEYKEGKLTLSKDNFEFLETLNFTEVTGSGNNGSFYKPKLTQKDGVASPDKTADWDEAAANTDYLSFDLYMRSKSPQNIYLDSDTTIKPVSKTLTWSTESGGVGNNPSSNGDYSRDCIIGAVRFSAVDSGGTRDILWIPAPQLKLNSDFTMSTGLRSGDSYKHTYYEVSSTSKVQTTLSAPTVTVNTGGKFKLGSKKNFAVLGGTASSDGYFYEYVTCHVWIEGEDPEARLALVNGNFTINLQLTID